MKTKEVQFWNTSPEIVVEKRWKIVKPIITAMFPMTLVFPLLYNTVLITDFLVRDYQARSF